MTLYFDSAYLAKCYLNEPDGPAVRNLARTADWITSSAWSIAELACVFHRQVREGSLSPVQARHLREQFLDDVRKGIWELLPISEVLLLGVEAATRRLSPRVYVRAGDTIHLVAAREAGFTEIWSNDRHLLRAAPHFGITGKSV